MSTKNSRHPSQPLLPSERELVPHRSKCVRVATGNARAGAPAHPLQARAEIKLPMQTNQNRPNEKFPDPWLFDSEALIRELDRCRETVLQIPITNANATHFGIQLAVNAIWNLRETLRELLHLHHEAQRQIRKQHMLELQEQFSQQAPDPSDPQKIIPIAKTARKTGRSSPGGWKPNESLPRASVTNRTPTRNRRG